MKKILEDLKDPKKKSIIMLVGYGVFFLFVFIIIATSNTIDNNADYTDYLEKRDNSIEKDNKDTNSINSYEYLCKVSDNEKINEVSGTKTKDKNIFTMDGTTYSITDNEKQDIPINIEICNYNNIEYLLNERTAKETTTYEDGTSKLIYNINVKEYFDYMKYTDKCIDIDCSNINIVLTLNKNEKGYIEKVIIDLNSYYKHKYLIEINYTNINNIKEISTN